MLKTYTRKHRQENEIIEDIHELCRLCLSRVHEAVPIFGEVDNACAALPMRIMICVGHEITQEESLPNSICTNCHQELDRYYKFRKKCENSYLKLKSHYNATRYRARISEVQAENNKKYSEEQAMCELQHKKQEEVEPQADEMERLVIVDEENSEYTKLVNISSVPETDVKTEDKEDETTEIQVVQQYDDINPDISTFLSAILVELGILVKNDQGFVVQDQGVTSFELETGDDEHLEFELVEEGDEVEVPVEAPTTLLMAEDSETLDTADNTPKENTKKDSVRKETAESSETGTWCVVCGRGFASRGALRRHGAVHSGVRPHACPRCGRRFAQKSVMERHKLVHEAVRPYQCPQCCKSFTQRGTLSAHARSHAAPHARPLALHACTRCQRVFLYASGLSRHMVSHTGHGFSCVVCQRLFNDKSSLLRHTRNAHPQPAPS